MITGVKHGWLDKKTYGKAARKGWLGLVRYIEPNGDIRNVCQGTESRMTCSTILTARNSPETCTDKRRFCGVLRRSYADRFSICAHWRVRARTEPSLSCHAGIVMRT